MAGWPGLIWSRPLVHFAGKSFRELAELEAGIQEQLDSGAAADPEYWQVRTVITLGSVTGSGGRAWQARQRCRRRFRTLAGAAVGVMERAGWRWRKVGSGPSCHSSGHGSRVLATDAYAHAHPPSHPRFTSGGAQTAGAAQG